jgi:chemotaxis protein CheD
VLSLGPGSRNNVPKSNIDFAFRFLETERIPILASDVGGSDARKVLFFAREGRVLMKRITGTLIAAVKQEEKLYLDRILRKEGLGGEVTLFGG